MLKVVKTSVRTMSRSLGYDIMPLRSVKERDFAIHLRQLFELLRIDCVLDVGANIGQYRDFLRDQVGYHGAIVSFEPVAMHVEVLRDRSRDDDSWLIQGVALGGEAERRAINVMRSDQFSSFLEPDNTLVPAYDGLNEAVRREIVTVRRLDDVLDELHGVLRFRRPYLKLDTQGFDLDVLRGATAALPGIAALQTEASVRPIYTGMPSYVEMIDHLSQRGFDLTGLYPVSRDAMLRLIEFDCVMVNRAVAAEAG